MAVLVPVDQWRRLEKTSRPTLKELLLSALPHAEIFLCRCAEFGAGVNRLR